MYKIKLIRDDYGTQIEKKIYETTNKFMKYGKEYYIRKHNNSYNSFHTLVKCRLYKMDYSIEKYVEIEIPNEWNIKE